MKAICLFSGPGGSSTGLRMAGIEDAVGIEWDKAAVATARAAGFVVEQVDVRTVEPREIYANYGFDAKPTDLLLQASPPCQGLSTAGKGAGREDLIHLFEAIDYLITEIEFMDAPASQMLIYQSKMAEWLLSVCSDERSPLTFEVTRWIIDLLPEFIMLEQVPAALPIWEKIGELLRAMGYAVWTGLVHAEQFGVPQTRKRAILLATLHADEMPAPVPTHSKYHNRTPSRLDEGVLPWVSMAEALDWGMEDLVGFPRKYDGRGDVLEMDGKEYRARDLRQAANPSFVVTEKARSWERFTHMGDVVQKNGTVRRMDQPSATLTASMDNGNWRFVNREALVEQVTPRVHNQSGTEFDLEWPADRPAPVIAGREIVTMPGANANRFNGSTKSRNDGIKVTIEEAGVLQSFPVDYPWTGTKTKRFEQVGNAVPPLLQAALTVHLLASASEISTEQEAA